MLEINFIDDGWFGLDKVGHFTRHVLFTLFYALVLNMSLWAVIYVDTQFDIFYEYMNSVAGIGFSFKDILYGRMGMIITLLVLRWIA
jgi:hypothetical protein